MSVAFWLVDSSGEEFTMSVTGRMVGEGAGCIAGGVEESVNGKWSGGGGEAGGIVEEITSLTQGEVGSGCWESVFGGKGESLSKD